jgi:imidazolonepropionase-like amidohydrolase
MNLQEIIETLHLQVVTTPRDFSAIIPESGYASDLLSCVMAGAKKNGLWVTLQAHSNIVAVAALLALAAVIVTEGAALDAATIAKANEEGVILLTSGKSSYAIAGTLWELGLRDA